MAKIYVGNLLYEASEHDLAQLFEEYSGEQAYIVRDDETGKSKGYGFVNIADELVQHAIKAIDGTEFLGRRVYVSVARSQGRRFS